MGKKVSASDVMTERKAFRSATFLYNAVWCLMVIHTWSYVGSRTYMSGSWWLYIGSLPSAFLYWCLMPVQYGSNTNVCTFIIHHYFTTIQRSSDTHTEEQLLATKALVTPYILYNHQTWSYLHVCTSTNIQYRPYFVQASRSTDSPVTSLGTGQCSHHSPPSKYLDGYISVIVQTSSIQSPSFKHSYQSCSLYQDSDLTGGWS